MSKHTPGPWTVHPMRGYEKQGWVEIWNNAHPVACSDGFTRTRDGESEDHHGLKVTPEDARLIAAAPDLLAALEGLGCYELFRRLPDDFRGRVGAAIAKARGGK